MANADATRALLKKRYAHSDIYVGTAHQLCAAGLVRPNQFPGQPGLGKCRARFFVADGLPVTQGSADFEPIFMVERAGALRYSVSVHVCDEEVARRRSLLDKDGNVPLDLPGPAAMAKQEGPAWAPAGWAFLGHRTSDGRDVFVATNAQIESSGLMDGQSLPRVEETTRLSTSFRSDRYGWVSLTPRAAGVFFVALCAPREIRFADYHVSDYGEHVRHSGTKEQLQSRGLASGIGFPGEPGCNRRKVTFIDPQTGSECRIELLNRAQWPGEVPRFELWVHRTKEEQKRLEAAFKAPADAEKAKRELAMMPKTVEAFRGRLIDSIRTWIRITLDGATQRPNWHGYSLDQDAVGEIHASFDAVVEAIVAAPVHFDAKRRAKTEQEYRAAIAAADKSFQAKFTALAAPNPQILGGSAQ